MIAKLTMNRIQPLDFSTARDTAKGLMIFVKKTSGFIPNSLRILANSPAVLRGFLGLREALTGGKLSQKLRAQIALTVSEIHSCPYCLSAHSFIGQAAGLSMEEITDARLGVGSDEKSDAVLGLARTVVLERGQLEQQKLREAREAGVTDEEIVEIVATVALTTLMNYINEIANTEIDFPQVFPRIFAEDLPVPMAALIATTNTIAMSQEIPNYNALKLLLRESLRRQHPEWIEPDGESPICDSYDARFAQLLDIFSPSEDSIAA